MGKPVTYDHLKSRKKPVQKSIWIALDPELADEMLDQEQKVKKIRVRATARHDDPSVTAELAAAEAELDRLTEELRKPDNSVKFVFRSVGRRRYDDLIDDHQPTQAQIDEVRKEDPEATPEFNPDTFPQALIAASIVEPKLSKDEVNEMFVSDEWNQAELVGLFNTALTANTTRRLLDLGNGSRGTNGSEPN